MFSDDPFKGGARLARNSLFTLILKNFYSIFCFGVTINVSFCSEFQYFLLNYTDVNIKKL